MIPVRLQLKNFLSYGEPEPLDFTTFDVACLSGDNGVGKSALLDAMTWAMFGAARGCEGGLNQDRLIRDGCNEAIVEFTFDLRGDRYRIVRRRSRNDKGESKGEVRLLVADGAGAPDGAWKNIADESLKATDEKIERILRMDYRTFTASAFFLQGHSEDFLARMSPSDRKEVFARLLDLGVYEDLEAAAKLRARETERSRQDVAARIGELEGASVDLAALEAELCRTSERSVALEAQIATRGQELEAARKSLAEIQTQQALLDREQQALVADVDAHEASEAQVQAARAELARIDELLSRTDEVAAALTEIEALRAAEADARSRQAAAADLKQFAAGILASIDADRRTITERLSQTCARIARLGQEWDALRESQEAIARLDGDLASTTDPLDALTVAREQLGVHQLAAGRLEEQIVSIDDKLAVAKDSLAVLRAGGGECPVCGSALDAAHRSEAKRRIQAETREWTASQQAARAGLATERKEAKRLTEEIRRLEEVQRDREKLAALRDGLVVRLERLDPLSAELDQLARHRAADEAALDDDAFAADRALELAALEERATRLYDSTAHDAILRRLSDLEPYVTLQGGLDEAGRRRAAAGADLEAALHRSAQLVFRIKEHGTVIAVLEHAAAGHPAALEAVTAIEHALDDLRTAGRELTTVLARVHERLAVARALNAELEMKRSDERRLAAEHRRYRRLGEAFGRGGIPDRIIDNALPELVDDANRVLGRLSDYEMSVRFELEGRTRSGKAKETFNVLVSHDGGDRDFAMFSGGEAFRVAFAVRLAMSKLLVRRAGARLETLVIDEGFGTQDPHGRERLVEAINMARKEFEKILVITHLDDLKDQFGVQIAVSKGSEGSLLQLTGA